ncbi:unnamed protein product [Clonostachys solani]|uniref:Carrier domain-containing protein n=1 Tax=Clonostachys solani TaxID=160281 RepID=A0A9P0ELT7_9HYPO|nr:unnamed protein product [Clonostachys solani]
MSLEVRKAPFGRRLLPTVIDDRARTNPNEAMFVLIDDSNGTISLKRISTSQFSNAINHVTWWLKEQLHDPEPGTVFGYIGPYDLRYFILMVASVKLGCKVLLSSPRNSIAGHTALIKQSDCRVWLTGGANIDVTQILIENPMPHYILPGLMNILQQPSATPYPYERQFEDARWDTLALIHTSGSTGVPKLVPLYLGTAACVDAFHIMNPVDGKRPTGTAGICLGLDSAVYFNWTVVLPPPGIWSADTLERILDQVPTVEAAFVAPSILQEISQSPRLLTKLEKLEFVTTAGGPTPQYAGSIVSKHVHLHQTMGSTEGQWLSTIPCRREDWEYIHIADETGYEMVHDSEELYELTFRRRQEYELTQSFFVTFPEIDIWHTKDLYSKHPTLPQRWKFEGRKDDLIVLSNGEKFNPNRTEEQLSGHPLVQAACVVGSGRFQPAVLLELAPNVQATPEEVLREVWSEVQTCNEKLPSFAKIHRSHVKVVSEPFSRLAKGTVSRYATWEKFRSTIEQLYSARQAISSSSNISTFEALLEQVLGIAQEISSSQGLFDTNANLFEAGFDSLSAQELRYAIHDIMGFDLESGDVFQRPSVFQLCELIWSRRHSQEQPLINPRDRVRGKIQDFFLKSFPSKKDRPMSVIITGTTGYLGSYILDFLYRNPAVDEIWCLNRDRLAASKQPELARHRGLVESWEAKTVKFLTVNLQQQNWGLSEEEFATLAARARVLIHNAWQVNFNLPLESFDDHLVGVKHLIRFGEQAKNALHVVFISSVSVAMNWNRVAIGPVAELPITNLDAPGNGYGESKLVAEHLIYEASRRGAFSASVCRTGQAGGPVDNGTVQGEWNRHEWLPTLIETSLHMRALPSELGLCEITDWIPIDRLASMLTDIALLPPLSANACRFYHLVNPTKTSWGAIAPTIQERLTRTCSAEIRICPLSEWVQLLEKTASLARTVADGPVVHSGRNLRGLKLIDFYRGLVAEAESTQPIWLMEGALSASPNLRQLPAVGENWMTLWMKQWGY